MKNSWKTPGSLGEGQLLPAILKTQLKSNQEDWDLYFFETSASVILMDEELCTEVSEDLRPYTLLSKGDFRKQIYFKGVPFLVGFFYSEKVIRLYSPRLNQELFWLENWEEDSLQGLGLQDRFSSLKTYCDKVASIQVGKFPSEIETLTELRNLPNYLEDDAYRSLENETEAAIKKLMAYLNEYTPGPMERFSDLALGYTADYALLRIHLLKFLALLPGLDHARFSKEVKRILLESFRRLREDSRKAKLKGKKGDQGPLPLGLDILFYVAAVISWLIPSGLLLKIIRFKVRFMAKRFIAGESIELASDAFRDLFKTNRDVTLDQLGELVVSEKEADHYCEEVLKIVKGLSQHIERGSRNKAGILRAHVSIKVSALGSDFKPEAFDYTYKQVAPRLRKILVTAQDEGVFINVDAEHYHYRDLVLRIYRKILLETPELKNYKDTGIVLQAYLRDGDQHFEDILDLAKVRGITMPIRLVKGAYWDAETVEAHAHSFDPPEFLNKEETDIHFRQLLEKTLKASPHLQLCLAGHNYSDHCFGEVLREKQFPEALPIEHQCLHMTYEALSTGLAKMGWAVRNYVPIGGLLVGMAYLVRRIMENSSQVGVLTIMRGHKSGARIEGPEAIHRKKQENESLARDISAQELTSEYFNIGPCKLFEDKDRESFFKALEKFKNEGLGAFYENKFLAKKEETLHQVFSPSDPSILVGSLPFAEVEDAERAVETSFEFYAKGEWANSNWTYRSSTLMNCANLMLAHRNDLSALISYESGKALPEALADVDEAIDFLNFYAREEGRIQKDFGKGKQKVCSRGVMAVISPWNFPLAIPCGMAASALVAGNTVILKSAEQTPLVTQALTNLFHQAGVPEEALIHLPGLGETVGAQLVKHEKVAGIVFTGSKAVGVWIAEEAQKRMIQNPLSGETYPVKVITEMGGKNAIIVSANAELDETVSGILYSAYAHGGQKCSAASRVLVDERIKGPLLKRLGEAVLDLNVGEGYDPSTYVNPLITMEDKKRLAQNVNEAVVEAGENLGKVYADRSGDDLPGNCLGPVVIELPSERAKSSESFAKRELFGPVLHVTGFKSQKEALELFNGTEYGLTGGIFSQSQDDIDYFTDRMICGNIYVNRPITGARVGIEPFGGFKHSGTGPKAGGKTYVQAFHHFCYQLEKVSTTESSETSQMVPSEYKFDLAPSNKGTVLETKSAFVRGLQGVISHLEGIFKGIYPAHKEVLEELKTWSHKNLIDDQLKKKNREIPGQISYNDFKLKEEGVVIVEHGSQGQLTSLIWAFMAVGEGIGVTVLTKNAEAYEWWLRISQFFIKEGIPRPHFEVYFPTEEILWEGLKDKKNRTMVIGGALSEVQSFMKEFWDRFSPEDFSFMKKVMSSYDGPSLTDFDTFKEELSLVRSFAINTMRHGAPLEVDL